MNKFSGDKSVPFWDAVGRIKNKGDRDLIYGVLCTAQEMETEHETLSKTVIILRQHLNKNELLAPTGYEVGYLIAVGRCTPGEELNIMAKGFRITRTDFDNMENSLHGAISVKELGIFIDDEGKTAHVKVDEFLSKLGKISIYQGWTGKLYPQFKIEIVEVM